MGKGNAWLSTITPLPIEGELDGVYSFTFFLVAFDSLCRRSSVVTM